MASLQLLQQPDLTEIKRLQNSVTDSLYQVKLDNTQHGGRKIARVLKDIRAPFKIQREKDLLRYLNQFAPYFPHFYEIRKVGFQYVVLLEDIGELDLTARVKRKGVLSESQAMKLLKNMIKVLQPVHEVGFVHSNIRPENILLGKKQYYLLNWSHAMPALSSYETELLLGDQSYTAPERMNAIHNAKSDVYQLGCTLYFAMTGKHIYRLNKVKHYFDQLYAHAFHSPRQLNRLPIFWRHLIIWMTQKDPDKRPSIAELKKWVKEQVAPKWIRKSSRTLFNEFPTDSLAALAEHHYMYANFKQATLLEAQGDLASAFNLYENLAFQGYSRAEYELARCYLQGDLIEHSDARAINLYHQAFQKGNPAAAFQLARFFELGQGVAENSVQAFKLYRYAAMRGHLPAQRLLGLAYFEGRGVKKDLMQSRFWIGMAAHYGDEIAKDLLRKFVQNNRSNLSRLAVVQKAQ